MPLWSWYQKPAPSAEYWTACFRDPKGPGEEERSRGGEAELRSDEAREAREGGLSGSLPLPLSLFFAGCSRLGEGGAGARLLPPFCAATNASRVPNVAT